MEQYDYFCVDCEWEGTESELQIDCGCPECLPLCPNCGSNDLEIN